MRWGPQLGDFSHHHLVKVFESPKSSKKLKCFAHMAAQIVSFLSPFPHLYLCACTKWFKYKLLLISSLFFFTFIEPKGFLFFWESRPSGQVLFNGKRKKLHTISCNKRSYIYWTNWVNLYLFSLSTNRPQYFNTSYHILFYTIKYKLNPIIRGVNILFNCHVIALSGFFFLFF